MKAKDIFGLAVRLIGLVFLYQGISMVPTAFSSIFPLFPHIYWRNIIPSVIMVGWPLLAAYWLIRGAPPINRLAYGEEMPPPTKSSEPRLSEGQNY